MHWDTFYCPVDHSDTFYRPVDAKKGSSCYRIFNYIFLYFSSRTNPFQSEPSSGIWVHCKRGLWFNCTVPLVHWCSSTFTESQLYKLDACIAKILVTYYRTRIEIPHTMIYFYDRLFFVVVDGCRLMHINDMVL